MALLLVQGLVHRKPFGHGPVLGLDHHISRGSRRFECHHQRHRATHLEVMIMDGKYVMSASYNFTAGARPENNAFDIIDDPERAARFTAIWKGIWAWMAAH